MTFAITRYFNYTIFLPFCLVFAIFHVQGKDAPSWMRPPLLLLHGSVLTLLLVEVDVEAGPGSHEDEALFLQRLRHDARPPVVDEAAAQFGLLQPVQEKVLLRMSVDQFEKLIDKDLFLVPVLFFLDLHQSRSECHI